jgi:uncharacterized protein (TIGR02147 family)
MIFQYSDYRKYLLDSIRQLPKKGFGEAKKMAEYLGVSSTYMSHVLSGAKVLTIEQANRLSQYLGHGPLETDYFFYLVQNERAGTRELKKYCDQKLQDLKQRSLKLANRIEAKKVLSDEEKSVFYSSPVYSMTHIYSATDPRGRSLDEVASRFDISRARTSDIMRFLVGAGLCAEKDNRFTTGNQGTHLEKGSPHLLKHHTNWRLRAIQAAENLSDEELMYTVNVALSIEDFSLLREEMVGFIKTFLEKVYPSPSEEIACLNLDWFWIKK